MEGYIEKNILFDHFLISPHRHCLVKSRGINEVLAKFTSNFQSPCCVSYDLLVSLSSVSYSMLISPPRRDHASND